jgi:hypothetical protein
MKVHDMKNMTENLQINPMAILHTSGYRSGSEISIVHRRGWLGGVLAGIILMNSAVADDCSDAVKNVTRNAINSQDRYVTASEAIGQQVCSSKDEAAMAELSRDTKYAARVYISAAENFCKGDDYSQRIVKREGKKLLDIADKALARCPL